MIPEQSAFARNIFRNIVPDFTCRDLSSVRGSVDCGQLAAAVGPASLLAARLLPSMTTWENHAADHGGAFSPQITQRTQIFGLEFRSGLRQASCAAALAEDPLFKKSVHSV
jgi:hypothetical protein